MFVPKKKKQGHIASLVSRKAVNRFIDYGLRIMAAKPCLYFHQTLSFPMPESDAKHAKQIFTKFIKGVLKFYQSYELAVLYVQERRNNGVIHFHVCFLFFRGDSLPFAPSRMRRDFRTDIYRRWNRLNDSKCVHDANELHERPFNLESLSYFTRALVVADDSTKRPETNWWGKFNEHIVLTRSAAPTMEQRQSAFAELFRKASQTRCVEESCGLGGAAHLESCMFVKEPPAS